ncbi:MAG: histidine phosphatase family protein [Oscillospiraceae bacterium]
MKSYRLTIIRHGHTEGNENGRYIGTTDIPLSKNGIAELEKIAAEYEYPYVEKVYSSPLLRCIQTARILYPDTELVTLDGIKELDFGQFENKSVDELIDLEEYKEWLKGGLDNRAHGGETIREMIGRTVAAFNDILEDMMAMEIFDAAVVTHSGIMMNMLSCFGLPRMEPMKYACDVGEGYVISVNLQMWQTGGLFEIMGKVPVLKDSEEETEEI